MVIAMRGLYIHIPFCLSKCNYCDFNSYAGCLFKAPAYVNALLKEGEKYKGEKVDTVYIGGGTPTILNLYDISRLITGIKDIFSFDENTEFTVEMNPATAKEEYLKALFSLGVNRISMGGQSFDDKLLKILGRTHLTKDISESVSLCKKAGFSNISMDLMFSLPSQTMNSWKDSLEKAVASGITHISCYGLKIEEGTPFYENGVTPLCEELDREMYHYAVEFLENSGFKQYEISNFALKGKKSKHNLKYWHCQEYFGLGAGAHGYVGNVRSYNCFPIEKYIEKINLFGDATQEETPLTKEDMKIEKIIMGLRLKEGIDPGLVSPKKTEELIKAGFMEMEKGNIRFTLKGFDLSNTILSRLI